MNNNERLKKENILYRPEIDYDKSYDTISNFNDDDYDLEDIKIESNRLNDLKDKINGIAALTQLLPNDLKDAVKKPFEAIQYVVGDINIDPEKLPTIEEIITYNPPKETVDTSDEYPDSPFRDEEDSITVKISTNDIVEIIKKDYEYDLVSIIDDYIDKLDKLMNNYLQSVLTLIVDENAELYLKLLNNYNISTSKIGIDHKHLSDLVIRSQIARTMKTRMYNKLFNIDKTITHIRMCKVGVQQRIRYYEASYAKNDSLDNIVSNNALEASRKQYDQKYKQNFINLYKYLNSSVMVLTECLNQFINEAQAKIILYKKEGIEL